MTCRWFCVRSFKSENIGVNNTTSRLSLPASAVNGSAHQVVEYALRQSPTAPVRVRPSMSGCPFSSFRSVPEGCGLRDPTQLRPRSNRTRCRRRRDKRLADDGIPDVSEHHHQRKFSGDAITAYMMSHTPDAQGTIEAPDTGNAERRRCPLPHQLRGDAIRQHRPIGSRRRHRLQRCQPDGDRSGHGDSESAQRRRTQFRPPDGQFLRTSAWLG